ncbi:MAG: ATP-binding protein, partial [Candidatus Korarchaeum sp.]|nr:ATP-binding protein [Candidatus Korarchaeum sp.]
SGPAFEGAHIKCGMRAASGAIERVKISEDFDVEYSVIGDEKPTGLCGSGIVDAIAEMLRVGIIDTSGRIVLENHKRIRRDIEGKKEFVLVFKEESLSGDDIVITQSDIREIQKAKAAIYSGCKILTMRSNIKKENISEIMIAGAFGSYLNPESIRLIGMIPEIKGAGISFLGNTAGSGARMCLKSLEKRREAERIARIVKYVELAVDPSFMSEYISAMYLPHNRVDEFPETFKVLRAPVVSRPRLGSFH